MVKNNGFNWLGVSGIVCPGESYPATRLDNEFQDRMTISIEDGPDIVIIRTDVGWVVDAYHPNTGEMISALNVWDDDVDGDDDLDGSPPLVRDRETGEVLTWRQLRSEYIRLKKAGETEDRTFNDYLENITGKDGTCDYV